MPVINPAFIDDMGWHMAEVYGAITDQILINIAKYFPFYKPGSPVPSSSFEYQSAMLAQMGQVNRETIAIIRNGLQDANAALNGALEQAIIEAVKKTEPGLVSAVKKGILKPPTSIITAPNQSRAFKLYQKQAADRLNLVNTVMLSSTKQAYQATVSDIVSRINATQTALDVGAGEAITGVSSWNQAMIHAINRMKQDGITGFIDHGGHRWSAEAYAAMDIRTTLANTARAAVWETNEDFGNDLYSVSYHNGARPLCYDWQNKVISSTDNARVVHDLDGNEIQVFAQSATTYGEAAGLFGINCKHYPTPFVPGVSLIRGEPQDPETNARVYAESQEQRRLERKIREEKRDLLMLKAQGAPDELIKAQRERIRKTDDDIDAFCADTGRARRQSREGVYTKREFPNPHTYDPKTFEQSQRQQMADWFGNGGSQQRFTAGTLETNTGTPTPEAPAAPVVPSPIEQVQDVAPTPATEEISKQAEGFTPATTREEAEKYAQEHFGGKYSEMSYKGIDTEFANICNRVLTEVGEKFDVSELKGIQPMNMRTNMFRGTTAEAAYHWGGDGTLYINPTYYKTAKAYAAHKAEIDSLTKTCLDGGEAILKSGKYTGRKKEWLEALLATGRQCVAQSHDFVEGCFVHESGHMLEDKVFRKVYDKVFGTEGVFEGAARILSESRARYAGRISAYAVADVHEYVAESFVAWWYGETDILDPILVKVFETAMRS